MDILNKRINWIDSFIQLNWDNFIYGTYNENDSHRSKIVSAFNILNMVGINNNPISKQFRVIIGGYATTYDFSKKLGQFIKNYCNRYEVMYINEPPTYQNHYIPLILLKRELQEHKDIKFNIEENLHESAILKDKIHTLSISDQKKILKKNLREKVWETFGNAKDDDINSGKCYCCDKTIRLDDMSTEFGHIKPKCKDGKYTIDNIRPVCIQCNRGKGGMHDMHMYEYMVKNNMHGAKYLTEIEKWLYNHSEEDRQKILSSFKSFLEYIRQVTDMSNSTYDKIEDYVDLVGKII